MNVTRQIRGRFWLVALISILASDITFAGATPKPLTVDSTIGQLLDNDAAAAILKRQIPELVKSPAAINQARGLPLRALQQYAPQMLTNEKLQSIDAELAQSADAVEGKSPPKPTSASQDPREALQLKTISLWEGRAPDARGDQPQDIPTLTVINPDGVLINSTAVIVAPGGGYKMLATGHEGRQIGDWFAAHGVTAFVLSYRLETSGYRHPVQLHDAQRAIRWVRAHAGDYEIDPRRIGMIGFSAGGHLTAMASTLFDDGNPKAADPVDRASSRPDFAVLAYPAIIVDKSSWGWLGLADEKSSAQTKRALMPAENIRAGTPPTFIFHTNNDGVVSPANPITYYNALHAAKVPVEMHIFEQGSHGQGFAMNDPALSVWPTLLQNWMAQRGLLGTANQAITNR